MKIVELRRHTANDGDELTPDGVDAAIAVGEGLNATYDLAVSSGAQRATQTIACFLAGLARPVAGGVIVETGLRSAREDRWFAIAKATDGGSLQNFLDADPNFVDQEAKAMGDALRRVFERLADGGRALVVGHSPMHETAIYGLTGSIVEPISKGAGVLVVEDGGRYRLEPVA